MASIIAFFHTLEIEAHDLIPFVELLSHLLH